jgi:hypothetical protein
MRATVANFRLSAVMYQPDGHKTGQTDELEDKSSTFAVHEEDFHNDLSIEKEASS